MKGIIRGWSNQVLDQLGMLDEETRKLSQKRLEICGSCPLKTAAGFCDPTKKIKVGDKEYQGCGCFLPAKTKVKDESCPAKKW